MTDTLLKSFRNVTGLQADFTNCFDCMVRDRLSKNASNSSTTGISNAIAAFSKLLKLGDELPCTQLHQFLPSIFVLAANLAYGIVIKSFLSIGLFANKCSSIGLITNITQTIKHLLKQVLYQQTRKDGRLKKKTYDQYTRPKGRSPSSNFFMRPLAEMGGVA